MLFLQLLGLNSLKMLSPVFSSALAVAAAPCHLEHLLEDSAVLPASCPTAEDTGRQSQELIPAHCTSQG